MTDRKHIAASLFAPIVVAGCASTQVTQQPLVTSKIQRPDHIWVYDFVATPAAAPANSDVAFQSTPQTAEQIAMGHQLGGQIADQLIADIQGI
jgi:hypothetical protein